MEEPSEIPPEKISDLIKKETSDLERAIHKIFCKWVTYSDLPQDRIQDILYQPHIELTTQEYATIGRKADILMDRGENEE